MHLMQREKDTHVLVRDHTRIPIGRDKEGGSKGGLLLAIRASHIFGLFVRRSEKRQLLLCVCDAAAAAL